jgi:hypothetical protein
LPASFPIRTISSKAYRPFLEVSSTKVDREKEKGKKLKKIITPKMEMRLNKI